MNRLLSRFVAVALVTSFAACSVSVPSEDYKPKVKNSEFFHRSVKQVTDVIVHDIFSPPVASRIYAYMCIAGYEAAINENPKFLSLAGQVNGLEAVPKPEVSVEYCYPLASVQAMLTVGKALIFSEDKMDDFYNKMMQEFKDAGVPEEIFERSIQYGTQVAEHVLAWASKDNYKQSRSFPKFSIEDDPATWRPTPPAYMDAVEPHWAKIRTFVIDSCGQFKPARPTAFSSNENSLFYKEAYEVYTLGKGLSEEQREIASFWDCNPFVMNVKGHVMFATKKISPGGHWMNITRLACKKSNADFVESAEAYALVSLSLIDGFISCWDEKYRSKLVRPESYINEFIDEDWVPLLQTPPFPEYTSGHSVVSSASSVTLTKLFGENFSFVDSTEVEFGLPSRSFKSFHDASQEAAISRIYGGIHYRPAVVHGFTEGTAIGHFIMDRVKTRRAELAEGRLDGK
ncbi:MAG: vanadium-dependent haloperoxidase [Cyclobacteriaceae bacterium]